jgi:hypothetical protein
VRCSADQHVKNGKTTVVYTITTQIASHLRSVYFGGNWTSVNYKETLADVTWKQACLAPAGFNSIAVLTHHASYYLHAIAAVLRGMPLTAKDADSFNLPAIHSEQEWQDYLNGIWQAANETATLISQLPDSKLHETFVQEKYGTVYRNLTGVIEHLHYHLGQIVFLKKMLSGSSLP